jgi:Protein of unknown function (DUF1810)
MGSDEFDRREDWLHGRDIAQVSATGRARSGEAVWPDERRTGANEGAGAGEPGTAAGERDSAQGLSLFCPGGARPRVSAEFCRSPRRPTTPLWRNGSIPPRPQREPSAMPVYAPTSTASSRQTSAQRPSPFNLGASPNAILGTPDDLKFRSCMTLFSLAADDPNNPFHQAFDLVQWTARRADARAYQLEPHCPELEPEPHLADPAEDGGGGKRSVPWALSRPTKPLLASPQ